MPCDYCGLPGCATETCPERLEDHFGTPADRDDDEEGEPA